MKALEDRLAKMETTLLVRNELTTDTTDQDRNIIPPPVQSESQPPTSLVPRESPGSHAPATSTSRLPPCVLSLEARLRATSFFDRLQDRVKSCMSGGPVLLHDTDKWLLRNTISETFNEFPIFHAPWLLDQLEQDLPTKNSNPTWWCCGCAIVSLAIPVKSLNRDFRKVAAFARAIFRTAYSDLPLMVSQGHDLQAVQAVLAMAMFSRLLGDIKTASILSSTAARMLQAYCLPGMDPDPPLSQADIEKQLRACFHPGPQTRRASKSCNMYVWYVCRLWAHVCAYTTYWIRPPLVSPFNQEPDSLGAESGRDHARYRLQFCLSSGLSRSLVSFHTLPPSSMLIAGWDAAACARFPEVASWGALPGSATDNRPCRATKSGSPVW